MDIEDKLLRMFNELNPDFKDSHSCTVEVVEANDWDEGETRINVMKNGHVCWGYTKSDLLFDYITKDWEEQANEHI